MDGIKVKSFFVSQNKSALTLKFQVWLRFVQENHLEKKQKEDF